METTILQSKLENKLLNRVFAITFALIILTWMYYFITAWDLGTPRGPLIVPEIIYLIIVVGLLIEACKPSLDFTFSRDKKRILMSVILFAVFVLINVHFWLAYGIVDWLPQFGW